MTDSTHVLTDAVGSEVTYVHWKLSAHKAECCAEQRLHVLNFLSTMIAKCTGKVLCCLLFQNLVCS